MAIHERLAQVRKDTKLTQVAFAKNLRVSRAAYLSYELGERLLPSSLILKLIEEYSINADWLLSGQGAKTPELHNENIKIAVAAVRTFAKAKKLKINPKREARLVLLVVRHLDAVGSDNLAEIEMMLENAA